MLNQETIQLAERLNRLELHAAHSGREVLKLLVDNLIASQEPTPARMMEAQYDNVRCLLRALPPYAPPLNSINQTLELMESAIEQDFSVEETKRKLEALRQPSGAARDNWESITRRLVGELPQATVVYTHTLSETVLGVLFELHNLGKIKQVNVTESRPNNDGWDTARRLAAGGVDVTLYLDAAMPDAIERSQIMLSGAEIINQDGSVVGKVGAYPAALVCQLFAKPVYIVADSNKINRFQWRNFHLTSLTAKDLGVTASLPKLQFGGKLFDITPAHLIRGYAMESGLFAAQELPTLISDAGLSKWLAIELGEGLQASVYDV